MKRSIVLFYLFVAAWALPGVQNELPLRKVDVKNPHENDLTPRIINGTEAIPHSLPYQAHLTVLSSGIGGWTCGGSLISPRHILTAAHCLLGAAGAIVYLGAHNLGTHEATQTVVESRNLILHADYTEERINDDIGLVVLDEPVQLNAYIDVIALPPRNINTDYTGYSAIVSGWGLYSLTGGASPVLQEANVTVISNLQCSQSYSIVIDSHLCTLGNGGESVCDGDSGGPLVTGNAQIGIVSFGSGGCSGDYPSGFARVSSYLDWLEEHTGLIF